MRNCARSCLAVAALSMILTAGSTGPSRAVFVTNGCAAVNVFCTLQELQSPSAFINIDNIFFNNFAALLFPPELIKVTPFDSPGSGRNSQVGLQFDPIDSSNNPWFADNGDTSPIVFQGAIEYDVNVLSGLPIGVSALSVTFIQDVTGGFFELLDATKDIDRSPFDPVTLRVGCEEFPNADCGGRSAFDSRLFGPVESLSILDFFGGRAFRIGASGNVKIGISQLSNFFVRTAPEPSTLTLFVSGLAGLGFVMRRSRSARSYRSAS